MNATVSYGWGASQVPILYFEVKAGHNVGYKTFKLTDLMKWKQGKRKTYRIRGNSVTIRKDRQNIHISANKMRKKYTVHPQKKKNNAKVIKITNNQKIKGGSLMKDPKLGPKKRGFVRNFYVFFIGFLVLWMSIFLFLTPTEELSTMEIIQFPLTAAAMLLIGTGWFLFFRRQIVDIVRDETEDKLTFITYSGKRTELSPKEIKSVTKTDNRYVFHLTFLVKQKVPLLGPLGPCVKFG